MTDRKVIRDDERYRSVSRTLFQLGAALLAAASIRLYDDQRATGKPLAWIVGSITLMRVG